MTGLMRARLNGGIDPDRRHHRGALARTAGRPTGRPDGAQAGLFASLHRHRGWPARNRPRRPLGPERRRPHRAGSGAEAGRRRALLPRHDQAGRGRNLRLAGRSERRERRHRDAACADHADRDAGPGARRQAVRHRRHQCRHAAGARPRPVVGAARRKRLCGRRQGRLSGPSRPRRANSARNWARRPTGGSDFPYLAASLGTTQSRRADRAPIRPDARAAWRWRRPFWPAANGSRSSNRCRTPSFMAPAAGDPEQFDTGRIDRGVVCGGAGAVDRAIADPADRPVDRGGRGRRPRRHGRDSGRCGRRDRRAGARVRACDGGSERQNRRARTRGPGTSPHRSRRATTMRSASACSAPRSNPRTTPSSRSRSTAPSPAGIRPQSVCSDIPRRKPSAKTSTLLVPADRLSEVQDTLRRIGWGESIEHNETVRVAQGRQPVEVSLSISPIKAPSGATIGIVEGRPRHHRKQPDPAGAAATDRGTAPHLRNIAGSDHGDGFQGISGPDQPELRSHPGVSAGGNDRPQRRPTSSIPTSREFPRGNARGAARASARRFRHALHPQGRTGGVAVVDGTWSEPVKRYLLRRPRHDRKPAGAGNLARKRAAGARHHQYRARRLRPDRRARHHPGLEFAGRE